MLNLHSLVKVFVGDGLVAQSLELVCGSHGGRRMRREMDGGEVQFAAARYKKKKRLQMKEMKSDVGSISRLRCPAPSTF